MKWSFTIARIAGIPIKIHATFILLLRFVAIRNAGEGGGGVLLGLVFNNESFQEALQSSSMFDIGLYTLLGWGLWAVILFYINSLVFKPAQKKQEASEHED